MCFRVERPRQAGLASLEFVLVLPILLAIAFLAVALVRMGHLRLDLQVSARNQAFEKAYAWKVPFIAEIDDHSHWYLANTTITHPAASADAGGDFHAISATQHERFDILRENTDIAPTVGRADATYQTGRVLGGWRIDMREQFAVVAVPIWQREQIPLGYDQYLHDRLKRHRMVVPGVPGLNAIKYIPFIDKVPGFGDIADFDFSYIYNGRAEQAVIDVFPKVKK